MATKTAVAIPAHCPSTADQSAPVSARKVHGSHSRVDSNGPSSHRPCLAASIEEPVTSIPTANPTSPIPSTMGMTSGFFTSRTATYRITPKASAGTQRLSVTGLTRRSTALTRRSTVRKCRSTPPATKMPPLKSSHPVPARNPPTTG